MVWLAPNGVDRDLLILFRFSPLHCAAVYNNFATVELLLRSNADASLQDDEGRTAQDCAREFAQAEDLFMAAVEVRSAAVFPRRTNGAMCNAHAGRSL